MLINFHIHFQIGKIFYMFVFLVDLYHIIELKSEDIIQELIENVFGKDTLGN